MKRIGLICCLSISCGFLFANNPSDEKLLMEIRAQLSEAFENETVCERLIKRATLQTNRSAILEGYYGALHVAMSRHASLFRKMGYFDAGTEILEKAIKNAPDEVELRFLRLTIQLNVPGFLGYSDKIEGDKRYLMQNYQRALPDLRKQIVAFVQDSDDFTSAEKAKMRT